MSAVEEYHAKMSSPDHVEKVGTDAFSVEGGRSPDRDQLERKLVRKLDLRFSFLIIIYILNYIDRNNASAARSRGLEADLHLVGQQYPTILSILYVGYILMQVPSNMIVQYTGRPSIYLPFCIFIWGGISALTATVHNFTGAVLVRFFLGVAEAPFFAGAVFLLSKWFRKDELGVRVAVLYCGSLISNAFGPLMAAGILANMEGDKGIRAWRWLFIVEGSLTMFIAVVAVFILPDFPHNSRGFSPEERALAQLRMAEDVGHSDTDSEHTTVQGLVAALTDYKVYVMALSLASMVISLSFNQFFPTLTATLGYNHTQTLLLCAPPFAFATIVAFAVSRHSDRTQERYWHIVIPMLVGIVGFVMAMSTEKTAPRFVSLFLMAASYAGFVCFYPWISSTFTRPAMKRAVCIAFINAFSQLGNVTGAYIFPVSFGPSYRKSYAICIGCFVFSIVGITFHRFTLARLNRELEAHENANQAERSKIGKYSVEMPQGFRYVL